MGCYVSTLGSGMHCSTPPDDHAQVQVAGWGVYDTNYVIAQWADSPHLEQLGRSRQSDDAADPLVALVTSLGEQLRGCRGAQLLVHHLQRANLATIHVVPEAHLA